MDFGVDLTMLELNLGYHTTISENLDFTAQIGYLDVEVDAAGIKASFWDDVIIYQVIQRFKIDSG